MAVQHLGRIGEGAREAASDIAALLKEPDQTLRLLAAQSLGTIGARTPDVISALEAAKADANVAVARYGGKAAPSSKP